MGNGCVEMKMLKREAKLILIKKKKKVMNSSWGGGAGGTGHTGRSPLDSDQREAPGHQSGEAPGHQSDQGHP